MDDTNSLLIYLRQKTKDIHQDIESQSALSALVHSSFSLLRYQEILSMFYLFYSTIEPLLLWQLDAHPKYIYKPRLPLLLLDLQSLGVSLAQQQQFRDQITPCSINTPGQCLGVLYVIEGSTLGGKHIQNHLKKFINVEESARFFLPHGVNTGRHWQEFCRYLNRYGQSNPQQFTSVGDAAIEAFRMIQRIFYGTDNSRALAKTS